MIAYRIIVIAAAIGILPAIVISWLLLKMSKKNKGIGVKLLLTAFFWGVLTAVPASVIQIINYQQNLNYFSIWAQNVQFFSKNYLVSTLVMPMLFVALVEEFSKGLGIVLVLRSFAKSPRLKNLKINPGLLAGVLIGLAFGVTENGVYFANNFVQVGLLKLLPIVLLRFLLSTSAHIIYSGLLGSFLVDAWLADGLLKKIYYLFLAVIIPVGIHTLFDVLVSGSYGLLVVPLLFAGLGLLIFRAFWIFTEKDGK